MTVLQLISSEGFYGAENMLVALAEAQLRLGHRPVIAVFEDARDPHTEIAEQAAARGIETHLIPCKGRFDRAAVGRIRQLLRRLDANILHCHGYKADIYGFAAARNLGIPLVSTCHNWPDRRRSMRIYAWADRLVLRWFDQVTTPSKHVASILEKAGVPNTATTVIDNGIDMARFQDAAATLRREVGQCDFLIGSVGRLTAAKGGEVLLRAAQSVISLYPRAEFVFVGDGPCRAEWEGLATELGIRESVFFAGTRSDMPGVYASLDLLALASFDEAMPMCLLEGMAAARPVIATRVGEIPQFIEPGVTGLLVEPGDSAALANALVFCIEKRQAACELGRNGQSVVARRHSSDAMAHNYLAVYEKALSGREKPRVAAAESVDPA